MKYSVKSCTPITPYIYETESHNLLNHLRGGAEETHSMINDSEF